MADLNTYTLQIMASDHMVYDGEAYKLSLYTTEGSVGILANHSNIIMAVVPGTLEYETPKTGKNEVVVSDGLLKVENGEVMVLVDTAEKPEDIDEARARRAAEAAREELRHTNSNREMEQATAELSRAISRIKASTKKHRL